MDGNIIFEGGYKSSFNNKMINQHSITLDEGEQIIGVVSHNDGTNAEHYDL